MEDSTVGMNSILYSGWSLAIELGSWYVSCMGVCYSPSVGCFAGEGRKWAPAYGDA